MVAVGTTVVRALESAARPDGTVLPERGWTDLVLGPDRPARVVDGLITGMHAPDASHLLLLEAVAGGALVQDAYDAALERRLLVARVRRPLPAAAGSGCPSRDRQPSGGAGGCGASAREPNRPGSAGSPTARRAGPPGVGPDGAGPAEAAPRPAAAWLPWLPPAEAWRLGAGGAGGGPGGSADDSSAAEATVGSGDGGVGSGAGVVSGSGAGAGGGTSRAAGAGAGIGADGDR